MINLFKKKKEKIEGLALVLVHLAQQYLQEMPSSFPTTISKKDYGKISLEYRKLSSLGLGNTKNARLLKEQLEAYDKITEDKENYLRIKEFIKKLKSRFGGTTFLVGTEQFRDLLQRYDLKVGALTDYTGTIPDKNIKELERVKEASGGFDYGNQIPFWKIEEVSFETASREIVEELKEYLERKHNLIFADEIERRYRDYLLLVDIKCCNPDLPESIKKFPYDYIIRMDGQKLGKNPLLIACPGSQLKSQPLKFTEKAIDPIVFTPSPYGIVVHSIWGEEAEDDVIKEYKQINDLL